MGDLPAVQHRVSDAEVLALVREPGADEARALARVHASFDPALIRYLEAITGTDAVVLAERTWIEASRRLPEFPESGARFPCWLLSIAHEQVECRDRWSWRHRHPLAAVTETGDFSAATIAGRAAASRIAIALPADQAEVLLAGVVFGCTVEEIAHATGRSHRVAQALHDEAGRTLEQAFGQVEGGRLLERASRTTSTKPPPEIVAAMVRAVHSWRGGRGARPAAAAAKVSVIALAVVMTATSAAAATGTLPDAAQHRFAGIAARVGIQLPDPSDRQLPGPSVTEPADPGSDPAPDHGDRRGDSHGADVSDVARDSELEGPDKGRQIADTARDGHGRAPAAGESPRPEAPPSPQPPPPPPEDPPVPAEVDPPRDQGQAPPAGTSGKDRSARP